MNLRIMIMCFLSPANRYQALKLTGLGGAVHKVERGGVTINAVFSVLQAVMDGFGIHAGPRWAFQEARDRGDGVEILQDHSQLVMPMSALRAPTVLVPARIQACVDFAAVKVRKIGGLT
jgi:DNA-binding transcriptional LysR family regulator